MTERTVAAHQPNYLPWLGYFHKIAECDVFVFLDDVEYSSGAWINRNRIKTPDGWTWLTVPVSGNSGEIRSIEIAETDDWADEHAKSLRFNYGKAPHYDELADLFATTYDREWRRLQALNTHLIREIADCIGLDCEFVSSSEFGIDATDSERILGLCRELDADRYLSGTGAKSYMDEDAFHAAGVDVTYQSIEYPTYTQRFDDFVPELSIVDPLFNCGPDRTIEMIREL